MKLTNKEVYRLMCCSTALIALQLTKEAHNASRS